MLTATFGDEMILAHHRDPLFMQAWADYREETLGCDLLRRAIGRKVQILHDGENYWPWDIVWPHNEKDRQGELMRSIPRQRDKKGGRFFWDSTCRMHHTSKYGLHLSCLDPDGVLATLPHLLELLDRTDHRRKA